MSSRPGRWPLHGLVVAIFVSQLGTAMSGLAIPWLVLITTGSAAKTGVVGFAEMAPYVAFQAMSGPLADRLGLRRACVFGNAAAAVLVCVIPGLYALGVLSLVSLIAVVAVAGSVRGVADAATSPLVPTTARIGDVPGERAAGLSSVGSRAGLMIGLPLAGVLISITNAATVVLIDGVTFAVAAALVAVVVPVITSADAEDELLTVRAYGRQLRQGLALMRADRLILGIVVMVAMTNLLDQALSGVFIPVWVNSRLHDSAALGLIGGSIMIGSLIGALVGTWLGPRLPRWTTYSVGYLLGGSPPFLALAWASSLLPVIVVGLVAGLAAGCLNPILGAVMYERVPPKLQARVLGVFKASSWVGIPFGSLVGGALAQSIGLTASLLATGSVMLATTLAPFVFPVWRRMNDRPTPAAGQVPPLPVTLVHSP